MMPRHAVGPQLPWACGPWRWMPWSSHHSLCNRRPFLCHPGSLWLFRSFRIRRTLPDVLQPPSKTVIL